MLKAIIFQGSGTRAAGVSRTESSDSFLVDTKSPWQPTTRNCGFGSQGKAFRSSSPDTLAGVEGLEALADGVGVAQEELNWGHAEAG